MSHSALARTRIYSVIPQTDIEEKGLIGSGGFGAVYEARHKHWGTVAIKRIFAHTRLSERELKELKDEADKMAQACFKNVALLYGVIMEPGNYSLVLEYMEHGSLKDFQEKFVNPWAMRKEMIYHIILGMNYLHTEVKIIHRDMKIENVLVGDGFEAKVCDFGLAKWKRLSKKYSKRKTSSGARPSGTISHIAPESLSDINAPPTYSCDVYSFGITLWEIITGKTPFENTDNSAQISLWVRGNQRPDESTIPSECPELLKTMMQKCWHQNPEERPTFGDLKRTIEETIDSDHKVAILQARTELTEQQLEKCQTATIAGSPVGQPEEETDASVRAVTDQMASATLASHSQPTQAVPASLSRTVDRDADQSVRHASITKKKKVPTATLR